MNSIDLRQFKASVGPARQSVAVPRRSFLETEIRLFSKKFNDRRKQAFFMELHSMLSCGLNLKTALEIMIQQEVDENFQGKFKQIERYIVEGHALHQSLQQSGLFSTYECVTIKTGEETGRLAHVLQALSAYYASRIRQKRQLIAAVSYPAVILSFSVLVVIFLMTFMIPMFESVFTKFNNELPASTKAVFTLSQFVRSFWIEAILVIVVLISAYVQYRNSAMMKSVRGKIIGRLPFFGAIYRDSAIAGFCRSMAFLISSKLPLNRCIELQYELCTYLPILNSLPAIEEDLLNGHSLHLSFGRVPDFNMKFIAMVRIGEEINQLEKFFDTLSEQYTSETDFRISQMNALLEPFLIIFLGVVVGFILITMYLPMFEISNSFSQ